eukprot:2920659-Rhodomonas_salina.1
MERRSVDRGRPRRERRPSVEILDPAADVRSSSSAVFQLQGIAQAMQSTRALASPTQRPTRADAAQHPVDWHAGVSGKAGCEQGGKGGMEGQSKRGDGGMGGKGG